MLRYTTKGNGVLATRGPRPPPAPVRGWGRLIVLCNCILTVRLRIPRGARAGTPAAA